MGLFAKPSPMERVKSISIPLFLSLFAFVILHPLFQSGFGEAKEIPAQGGVYRRPLDFSPKTLDPALSIDIYAVAVIQQVFDGLVQFDRDLNVIPAIARSWKISPDGLTYTFYLREGVRFHNGTEVTANDFIYSITRIIEPKTKSPAASFLDRVLGIKEFQE